MSIRLLVIMLPEVFALKRQRKKQQKTGNNTRESVTWLWIATFLVMADVSVGRDAKTTVAEI